MPLVVNTNVASLNAQRYMTSNTNALARSMEKLASGLRINRAGDDAAGLQISENLRAQIRGSKKALDNVQDALSVLNIADGAMQQITENLQRMRELVVQGANDTYSSGQRDAIADELEQLRADIDRIASATKFNGITLLNGSTTAFNVQVGANNTTNDYLNLAAAAGTNPFGSADAASLAASLTAANITVLADAAASTYQSAITVIESAINIINTRRGIAGALATRLEGAANNLGIFIENSTASESRLRSLDVAAESATLVKNQILQQAAATVLAQANQSPSLALQLLGG